MKSDSDWIKFMNWLIRIAVRASLSILESDW